MSKYDKTAFTLTTLLAAHKQAISMWSKAFYAGEDCIKEHEELLRLETAIKAKKAEKECADEQNEAMRTTDMKRPAAEPLLIEDLWFKDGVAYGRTYSCGCCSEIMSSQADDYDYDSKMEDLDRMAAYVEQQEAKVQALREDFNDYCNSQENG